MKKFRLLRADEIECRVQRCTEKGVVLLLYKTARTDADLLDETVGAENWQNDFKVIDGTLYGGVGVDYGNGYIWKWDAGTESNTEAEKGRASDAFKRAGSKHGIGRELYSAPFVWIPADKCADLRHNDRIANKWVCYDRFLVSEIGYDDTERINRLVITTAGRVAFEYGYSSKTAQTAEKRAKTANEAALVCEDCGKPINGHTSPTGVVTTAEEVYDRSYIQTARHLCVRCWRKAVADAN